MVTYFDTLRDAEAGGPARDGLSPAAAAVAATLAAIFGPDVEASLRPLNQPLATVPTRIAMHAVIGDVLCSVYADPPADQRADTRDDSGEPPSSPRSPR